MCAIIQHGKYELNPILLFSSCSSFVFAPLPPFISLFKMDRASHYFFVTHIVWILSSAKPTVNVYVVVYWKLYLHMRLYVFSLYRVLILYIVDKCEFYRTRALFVRWHQVNSLPWFCPEVNGPCRGCICRGPGRGRLPSWDKTRKKSLRSHSGQVELQVIPSSLGGERQECKASSVSWTDIDLSWGPSCSDPSVLFFFLGY